MVEEIRRHRRIEGPVFVEYRLLHGAHEHGISPAVNISASGACFGVLQQVTPQTPMELQLHVGRLGSDPVTVRGRVVWVRPSLRQASAFEVGFEFTHVNARQIKRLIRRVYVYWRQVHRG